jgi:ABC-2 type transport system permease protein
MISTILKHEWRILRADRTAWLALFAFTAASALAIFVGSTFSRDRSVANQAIVRDADESFEKRRAQAASAPAQPVTARPDFGPRSPSTVGMSWGSVVVLPPAPLLSLAIGQADIYPASYTVAARTQESVQPGDSIESPLKLMTGHFDLAFVILFLYPLLIVATTFDLTSSEKEQGTLSLLLSQPVSQGTLVRGKTLSRILLIVAPGMLLPSLGLLFAGPSWSGETWGVRLFLWVATVFAYGLFWFALALWVNSLGFRSTTNALLLSGAWLLLVVVVPALVNLGVSLAHPVPSRVEFVTATRLATNEARIKGSELLGRFLEDHPELSADKAAQSDFAVAQMARDRAVAEQLAPVLSRYEDALSRQHESVDRLRAASPTLLAQSLLYDIAGTGADRQRHFKQQVDAFHEAWRAFFEPRVLAGTSLSAADYDAFPRFQFVDEPMPSVVSRTGLPLLILLAVSLALGLVGLRRYGRSPIAS